MTRIHIDYYFEMIQQLKIAVYDVDDPIASDLSKHDFIGEAMCNLSHIVTMRNNTLSLELRTAKTGDALRGTVIVRAEEVKTMNSIVRIKFSGYNLDKKDFLGKSDPLLEISRYQDGDRWMPVFKTDHVIQNVNPIWNEYEVSAQAICNGDLSSRLLVSCYDWNKSGKYSFIGSFETSLDELLSSQGKRFALINSKKVKKKKYTNSGEIQVNLCVLVQVPTFLDYISGGCEIKLMVAIDFTASNGNPKKKESLHYCGDLQTPNSYVQAIRQVGDILSTYDSTNMISAFGFGAKVQGHLNHCFSLNEDEVNPNVYGVTGVLHCYYSALNKITLYGPTLFSPIIEKSIHIASTLKNLKQTYTVLLILTDGVISDMNPTIRNICQASSEPLSIIIVGVGNENFSKMDELDGDDALLSVGTTRAERDIVQFVPFEKYKSDPTMLAREVLAELPSQVVEYYTSKGIPPNKPGQGINQEYVQNFDTVPQ